MVSGCVPFPYPQCYVFLSDVVVRGVSLLKFLAMFVAGDFPFGSSDPLNQGLPEWRQQPEANYYVVRTKPAVITCRATPAIQITFTCAGSQVSMLTHTTYLSFFCI